MDAKDRILRELKKAGSCSGADLARALGISRQAVNAHLRQLCQNGRVRKEGFTRGTRYSVAEGKKISSPPHISRRYRLEGLREDKVFDEVATLVDLRRQTTSNAFDIFQYAFTEMLNNAIDHSQSEFAEVELSVESYVCVFSIRDHGIGVFRSIESKFDLSDETEAVAELLKGKTTTMREKHTGEGIFFTSKAGDMFSLRSHETKLTIDNARDETFVGKTRKIQGTEVRFQLKKNARRSLSDVFAEYAPEEFDFQFERTRVLVRLYRETYISRSEAKRLVAGLNRFKEVVLDFQGVRSIGQGFADEVFRVFHAAHPEVSFRITNLDPVLRPIINHVVDNTSVIDLTID